MKKNKIIHLFTIFSFALLLLSSQISVLAAVENPNAAAESQAGIILRKNKKPAPGKPTPGPGSSGQQNGQTSPHSKGQGSYPQTGETKRQTILFTCIGIFLIIGLSFLWRKKNRPKEMIDYD